jgi:hypothetical protein
MKRIAQLKPFAGVNFTLQYLPDAEAERAASSLFNVLKFVNWSMTSAGPDPTKNTPWFDGVVVEYGGLVDEAAIGIPLGDTRDEVRRRMARIRALMDEVGRSRRAAEELVDFLKANGWTAKSIPKGANPNDHFPIGGINVVVGFKPNPYFDPQIFKETNNKMEQLRKHLLEQEREDERREKEIERRNQEHP